MRNSFVKLAILRCVTRLVYLTTSKGEEFQILNLVPRPRELCTLKTFHSYSVSQEGSLFRSLNGYKINIVVQRAWFFLHTIKNIINKALKLSY